MEKAGDDAAVVEPLLQLQSQSQSHQSQPPEDDTNQHQTQAPAPADVSPGEQQQQQGQQGQQGHYQQGEHRQEEEESHQQDQHQQQQQQHQHSEPPRPAPHDASATADPAQQMPMSQQAPLLPPMQFQHPQQHSQQQQQHAPPPPAHIQDGMTRQASPQHMNNMAQHQQHAPPPPPPPPPPAQNGNGVQYPNHAPPNYGYAPDPAMQQSLPVMQSNGAPPNGYHPQMAYQMAMPQQGLNTNQLSGTRHKKEIKRRTKTGCLTCRRRRIKCDEGHPTCRNCIKSKRECLGYDPVFKTQGQPATIQPAPGTGTGTLPPPPPIKAEAQMAAEAPQYSNVPQGYMPAASAGYSPASALQPPMDYAAAIDPALAPVNSALAPPPPPPPPPQEEYSTSLHPQRNVRQVGVDGLFTVDDVPPSFPPPRHPNTPLPPHEIDAIRSIYTMEYAPGLDRFFETTWYSDHGFNLLLGNMELLHYFAYCLDRFRRGQHDPSIRGLMSLEARLVWQLGNLPASVQANPLPPHIVTILQRIDVVRNLLCGTFMDPSLVPVSPPSNAPDPKAVDHYAQYLQDAFWHHLGRFVSIRDDVVSPDAAQQIAAALAAMRNILSMLENRDVLYSMAIARHFGGRMADFHLEKSLVSRSAEPDDPIAKLAVAMNFIRDEEAQGTTQAVQRFCGMCRRGWVLQRQN